MKEFEGKVALVTGGTSGIGRATALAFTKEGSKVVIVGRSAKKGEETLKLIAEANGEATFVQCDVSNSAEVQSLIQTIVQKYGRLDYACNSAGVNEDKFQFPIASYPEETWNQVIKNNLTSNFLCMKYEIQQMLTQGGGAIVNISSNLGIVGFRNACGYVTSKTGQLGLTRSAALEYVTQGIRVNAVCPGGVATPMMDVMSVIEGTDAYEKFTNTFPAKRLAKPEEIAGAVLWLCSDAASYVNGHAMVVDAAYTAQ
jgi:NAD(P)-dependent dehydrogenase (short-subunit alcohol dehydrogenase family)